jgi:hypothetical protein
MAEEIFQLNSDGTFRLKCKVKSVNDLVKVAHFFQDIKQQTSRGEKSIQVCKLLLNVIPILDVVDIILDYLTFYDGETDTHYIDLISGQIRDPNPTFPNDPIRQLRLEKMKQMVGMR